MIARSFLLVCFLLTSCSHLREFPIEGHFEGVKATLDRNQAVNLFITNGVGGFSEGDPDTLIQAMVASLGLQQSGPGCIREIVKESAGIPKSYGCLKRLDYIDYCYGKNVHVYVLDWSSATSEEKIALNQMDLARSNDRLPFINKIKMDVVNDGIADAILYLSRYRKEIEYPVIQSIRWIEEDAKNTQHENIIVGYSLGGLVIINSLDSMRQTDEDLQIAKEYVDNISSVFFLSNTYPLVELTEIQPKSNLQFYEDESCYQKISSCIPYAMWDWRESPLGRFVFEKRKTLPDFQIVSIIDPNDLLGYRATEYPIPSECGYLNAFLNENVRNVKTAICGYVNPITVHTGYGKNKKVLSMIIFGSH